MAFIDDIKDIVDTNIRQKTLPDTITRTNHAAIEDMLAEEIRVRGVIRAASTDELDEHSHENTLIVLVKDVGFFVALQTPDPADDDTTFDSADSGWLWEKWLDISQTSGIDRLTRTGDATYSLPDGWMIYQINLKPTTLQTQKVGLTIGGEEIMEATVLPAGLTKPIQYYVLAEGSAVSVYFTGITATTYITIYKRQL